MTLANIKKINDNKETMGYAIRVIQLKEINGISSWLVAKHSSSSGWMVLVPISNTGKPKTGSKSRQLINIVMAKNQFVVDLETRK